MSRSSQTYAWYTVILLTAAYICSFVDRYILGLLVEPIKQDLQLSDIEIGLLLGPAFALFYTTMGLPLGWLADRARRTWLVGTGIVVWSIATVACGISRTFGQLFAARIAVGVGEATLSPCALSIIADSFPEKRRGKPVAFYTAALSLGAGIASLAGATILAWSNSVTNIKLPAFGDVAPWQLAFIVVGVAGLPLALLMFGLREPARTDRKRLGADQPAGLRDALGHVVSRKKLYGGFIAMVCVMTIVAYSQGWLPATFERTWGWAPQKYAFYNGVCLLLLGPVCNFMAGWFSDRLYARGYREAPLLIVVLGLLLLIPSGIAAPLMPNAWLAFGLFQLNTVGIAILSSTAPTALLNITPGEIRGQVIAMYYIVISITGLMLGPTSIGLMSDLIFGEAGLRYAVSLVPAIFGLPVLLFIASTRSRFIEESARRQSSIS
jgi:MFS family permease